MDSDLVESCYTPAALKALQSFPVEAKNVELIAHSENVTFRVSDCSNDSDYVLKLHRPGYNSIEQRYAGMTTWLQGTPLSRYLTTSSDAEERMRFFRRIGELAAAIHNQSSRWKEPAGFERGRWISRACWERRRTGVDSGNTRN